MRETQFINKRKSTWGDWERSKESEQPSPNTLRKYIEESSDDVSFARTHYPNRSVRLFLNNILGKTTIGLNKQTRRVNVFRFWFEEVPDAIWKHRKVGVFSLLLFLFSVFVGGLSQHYDNTFAWQILGDGYMQMTIDNIADGKPMHVYADSPAFMMFLQIGHNNVQVLLLCMALGITFGIGTAIVVIRNGIMVGAFMYFFIQKGLWEEAFFAVMMHGTIELSAIALAGFVGFIIAKGLIFPKTLSLVQSITMAAKDAMKIALAIIPFTIIAAFIEGFFTRHYEMSYTIRGLFIFACFLLVVGYFVLLPVLRKIQGKIKPEELELMPEITATEFAKKTRSISEIFASSLILLRSSFGKAGGLVLAASLVLTGFIALETWGMDKESTYGNVYSYIRNNSLFDQFNFLEQPALAGIFAVMVFFLLLLAMQTFHQAIYEKKPFLWGRAMLSAFVHAILITAAFFLHLGFVLLIYAFIGFVSVAGSFQTSASDGKGWSSMRQQFRFFKAGQYGRFLVVSLLLAILPIPFFMLMETPLITMLTDLVMINADMEDWELAKIKSYVYCFLRFFILLSSLYFSMLALAFTLRHMREMATAEDLHAQIALFGTKKRTYGLEAE